MANSSHFDRVPDLNNYASRMGRSSVSIVSYMVLSYGWNAYLGIYSDRYSCMILNRQIGQCKCTVHC